MTLRGRLTLLAAGTVGSVILLASVICYVAIRGDLRQQIDDSLSSQGDFVRRAARAAAALEGRNPLERLEPGALERLRRARQPPGEVLGSVQLIGPGGVVERRTGEHPLPISEGDREVAARQRPATLTDRELDGRHLRVLTVPTGRGRAVQIARSLEDVDTTLSRLRLVLAALLLLGTAFAVVISRFFSRKVIEPVRHLTEAAEHITATEDLGRRIEAPGQDEVGRMATGFNAMLDRLQASRAALADSVDAQRRLVADASHALRTPITSLRTNIEVLLDGRVAEPDRSLLVAEVREQVAELSELINDVIELDRGEEPTGELEEIRLDALVREEVQRARRHAPEVPIELDAEPTVVEAVPGRLSRAVANLLENATKYDGSGRGVEVRVAAGEVTVRDHGPGISEDELAQIFDRFHRGEAASGRPGSGLGLAIVRQVAESHGGTVAVESSPGEGACFRLSLPSVPAPIPTTAVPTPPSPESATPRRHRSGTEAGRS